MKEEEIRKKIGLPDDTPMLDITYPDFNNELKFALWSTGSSSDYRNDRERPYNGQSHTDEGERGKTIISGLTIRDIKDCFIKAVLLSAPSDKYLEVDEFLKCWDFSCDPAKPTQYLLDRQNEPDYIHVKVELNTWRVQDVYKVDFNNIDPIAIIQNMNCEIEKMMGIYPNVPELTFK